MKILFKSLIKRFILFMSGILRYTFNPDLRGLVNQEIPKAEGVLLYDELLGKPFFYNPKFGGYDTIFGPSGVGKIVGMDCYGINGLEFDRDAVILDIGSHIGIFPRLVDHLFPGAQIYSLEPDPDNFSVLQLNNALVLGAQSLNLAIGSECGTVTLRKSKVHSWRSTLALHQDFFSQNAVAGDDFSAGDVFVNCLTLDNWVRTSRVERLDFVGITVPGKLGVDILKNSVFTLNTFMPIVSVYAYEDDRNALIDFMEEHEYRLVIDNFPMLQFRHVNN